MAKIEVQVVALSSSESSPANFVVVLEAVDADRKMGIIIGTAEAQAIAIHMERMQLPRPLTHDIFINTLKGLEANLREVYIHSIHDELFHASLLLSNAVNELIEIDARASDAIAFAIRCNAPIFVDNAVFEAAVLQEEVERQSLLKGSLASYSLEELESLLQDLLHKEDYESAGRIRDLIDKRKRL